MMKGTVNPAAAYLEISLSLNLCSSSLSALDGDQKQPMPGSVLASRQLTEDNEST